MVMGFLKKLAGDNVNKYSGNKDFLEASAAGAARVAAADGEISDDEIGAACEAISSIESLSKAYKPSEIEEAVMKQFKLAKTIMGRNQLKRELEDVAGKDIQMRQDVFMTAAMAADAVGGIGPEEQKALDGIAALLKVDGKALLAA